MVRDLRSRPSIGKNILVDNGVTPTRRGVTSKSGNTPVKAKRAKVESVIHITRSREPRVPEQSPAQLPSPSTKDEAATSHEETPSQRVVDVQYKGRILIITGIPVERQPKDIPQSSDRPAKHKLEDAQDSSAQDAPRKRKRVDWAARNARSPRRSLRNTQLDGITDQSEMDHLEELPQNAEAGPDTGEQPTHTHQPPTQTREHPSASLHELSPHTRGTLVPPAKHTDLGSMLPNVIADSFKSPATDVTDFFFDALAEQSAGCSPEQARKIASEPSAEQIFEQASEDHQEQIFESASEQSTGRTNDGITQQFLHSENGLNSSDSNQQPSLASETHVTPQSRSASAAAEASEEATLQFSHANQTSQQSTPSSESPNLVPFLPFPNPLPSRSSFADNAAYTLATKFPPLLPLPTFITALTSQPLAERSTSDLYELALKTQKALLAWQDEYIKLDKKTAPVAGPFPKKPATGGRQPIDPVRWEDDKEKELFGEGTVLADLVKRRAAYNPGVTQIATVPSIIPEGRELRKRKPDISFLENLGISEDDAGALTESKRARKPVHRFEVGQNNEGRRGARAARRGGGLLNRNTHSTGLPNNNPNTSSSTPARGAYDSDTALQSIDAADTLPISKPLPPPQPPRRLQKKGRLSALQNSIHNDTAANTSSNDTTPSPTPDPADGDFSDANPHLRRQPGAATKRTAGAGGGGTAGEAGKQHQHQQRNKSDKRSESMTAWWAERKKKAKALAAAAVEGAPATVGNLGNKRGAGAGAGAATGAAANKLAGVQQGKRATRRSDLPGRREIPGKGEDTPPGKTEKVFGPGGLDARGGVMEGWSDVGGVRLGARGGRGRVV